MKKILTLVAVFIVFGTAAQRAELKEKKKEQRKPWSREEEELLLELRRSGHLIREISKIMNRSEASVLKRSQKILDLNKVERPRYFRKSKT